MTDTTGSGDATDTDGESAGRQLRQEYQALFPVAYRNLSRLRKADMWRAAAAHGATLEWALQTVGLAVQPEYRVGGLMQLASKVPVDLIDGLLADGWTQNEIYDLIWRDDPFFPETLHRTRTLYRTAPEFGGPDGVLLPRAFAAVLAARDRRWRRERPGLTDLQALRWLQAVSPPDRESQPGCPGQDSRFVLAVKLAYDNAAVLQEWVPAAGPDGWVWPAAGYTLNETRVLLALPEAHPDRPRPDQLAVMAALRQT